MPSTYCSLGIILGPFRNHCGIILGQSWEHAYKIYTMYNYGTILGTCSPNSHNASMLETCRSSGQVCFSHFVLQVRTPPKNKSGDNNTDFQKPQNQKKAHWYLRTNLSQNACRENSCKWFYISRKCFFSTWPCWALGSDPRPLNLKKMLPIWGAIWGAGAPKSCKNVYIFKIEKR